MTNKPMLSVDRELLEKWSSGWIKAEHHAEMRAILDKPVFESQYAGMNQQQAQAVSDGVDEILHGKPAAQHQGEPVAWRYKKSWEKTGWKVCDKHPTDYGIDDECYEIQALYAEQPAPVADQAQCEECKGWGYHENHHEGGGTECGECGGSGNATVAVAVVMPERKTKADYSGYIEQFQSEAVALYNEALDDVARLNGVKP